MKTLPATLMPLAAAAMLAVMPAAAQVGPNAVRIGPPAADATRPQIGPSTQTPELAPWEKALRRFYEREKLLTPADPFARDERTVRGLYADPARKLGLPDQETPDALRPTVRPSETPALPGDIVGLDSNGDGAISEREYMEQRFRRRPVAPGPAAEARRRNIRGRVLSRFNGADIDGNGILSADELKGVIDPRF
jgi:hypothetical protein